MSSGHHFRRAASASSLEAVIAQAAVKKELARKRTIDRTHDLPYLAGYSNDGGTVYIDRHMPPTMKYKGREIDTDAFLILHEKVEKTLIDQLGFDYWKAHRIATRAEEDAEDEAGVPFAVFQKFFKPYIKADAHEKLIRVPADLDMTPYLARPVDRKLVARMRMRMGVKISKHEAGYKHGLPQAHCGICEHYSDKPGLNCALVLGHVEDEMWCQFFERK